jgi:hypothetical protein
MSDKQENNKNYNLEKLEDCMEVLNIFLNKANKSGAFSLDEAAVLSTIIKKVQAQLFPASSTPVV